MLIDCLAMRALAICVVFIKCFWCSNTANYYDKDFCTSKPDGLQTDPEDCRAYYDCTSGRTRHRIGLSVGLMFDPKIKQFRHSDEVNCTVKKVYHERWSGVYGTNVADLEASPEFPCDPSLSKFIDTFCIYNAQKIDNYGQRLRSFFRAPESGRFTFQTSCDDACQLWLSDNELPSGKRLIVHQQASTSHSSFDMRDDQSSKKIYLTKGKLYYIELLHKQDTSYGFMCVGVKFPTMKKERPVSSKHLVMGKTELSRIGCQGSNPMVENARCVVPSCQLSPQQKFQSFKSSMDILTKELQSLSTEQSPSSQQHLTQITEEITRAINNVLEDKRKYQWRQSNSSLAMQIAEVTESFGKELARKWYNETSNVGSLAPNIVLQASVLTDSYAFSAPQVDKNWQGINDSLSLKVIEKNPQNRTKAFSVIYKGLHEMLPSTLRKVAIERGKEGLYKLNSRIIGSVVIPQAENQKLDVLVTLQHVEHRSNATLVPVCVWWDFNNRNVNSSGMWSSLGCELDVSSSNETHSVCKCNHLTNFAVLMKVKSDANELDEAHTAALEIITYVGCGLSLVGVSLTVVIITCLSGLRSERNLIHLNLSVAIGIFQVIFLAGIEATTSKVACTLVAVLLHYFLLVSFAWMLVEGVYLYIMVITVFESSKEQLRVYGACAYGLPGIIVLIAASVAHGGYGTDSSCWLSVAHGVVYAFVAPALLVIVANIVILGMVMREIIKVQTNGVSHSTKLDLVKSGIRSAVVLVPLLGITWLFGILALDSKTVAFQYLFAICSSSQGFFIFVFHCLLNSEIRKALQRKKEIWSSRRTTLLAPSSLPGSLAKDGQTLQGATVSDVNMLSLSEDTHNSEVIINSRTQVGRRSPTPDENHDAHDQADIIPNKGTNEHRATPAWLERKSSQGSAKVKLPPVSASVNKKKKKHHRNPRDNSKAKTNAAIEPVQEEAKTPNMDA